MLGAAACPPDELDVWIRRTRALTDRPFGVDTLLPASVPDTLEAAGREQPDRSAGQGSGSLIPPEVLEARDRFMDAEGLPRRTKDPTAAGAPRPPRVALAREFSSAQLEVVLDHRVPVYVAGLGVPPAGFMGRGRQLGMRFMGVAGQSRHARKLAAAGVDALVAQGTEGGGHNSPIGTLALIPQAVDAARPVPVLGAGGISDGRGIAAAFMLGAVGVWVGTRFLATQEANIPDYQKQVLLRADDKDTMVSRSATGKPARVIRGKWADLYERGELVTLPHAAAVPRVHSGHGLGHRQRARRRLRRLRRPRASASSTTYPRRGKSSSVSSARRPPCSTASRRCRASPPTPGCAHHARPCGAKPPSSASPRPSTRAAPRPPCPR